MHENGLGDRAEIAAMAVRCRVTHIPELARQEVLGARLAVLVRTSLRELLVAEPADRVGTRIVTQVVTLEVGICAHDRGTLRSFLESRPIAVLGHVECVLRATIHSTSTGARWVIRIRFNKVAGFEDHIWCMAAAAANVLEHLHATTNLLTLFLRLRPHHDRRAELCLEDRNGRQVTEGQLTLYAIIVKVRIEAFRGIHVEALFSLHAVVVVHCIGREFAK